MKNLLRVVMCLSVVFILAKIGKNGKKEYLAAGFVTTTEENQAFCFPTVKDAYGIQVLMPDSWDIVEK